MGPFLLRRLWQSLLLLVIVTILVFVIVLMAGDPVRVLLPIERTAIEDTYPWHGKPPKLLEQALFGAMGCLSAFCR